jgi:hypothetical protein
VAGAGQTQEGPASVIDEPGLPSDLEAIDRSLREARFAPRASFGPELLGRLRRGERLKGVVPPRRGRPALYALAASIAAVAVASGAMLLHRSPKRVLVDRCCYDLDGGGRADDGVRLLAERDARIHRLRVYEDRDRSGALSSGDVVRLDRGDEPTFRPGETKGLVTVERCCLDFDGGGPNDDVLLVLGVPPDRVMMAAIYERPAIIGARSSDADAFPLR